MQAVTHNYIKDIPQVAISPQGIFKYILIEGLVQREGKADVVPVRFVRGDRQLEYHKENFVKFMNEVKGLGFEVGKKNASEGRFEASKGGYKIRFKCLGGGRIEHNYEGKKCFIYGYSQSYGSVQHLIAQELISQALHYPINEITTSQEGY